MLSTIDMTVALDDETYKKELVLNQVALTQLGYQVYVQQRPVVIIFEGWDAAGKGGAIKRITEKLDPRGYSVYPIAAPAGEDKTHHYLYRFWRRLPEAGQIAIFDRSWYGRVMVERMEKLISKKDWEVAYRDIVDFERNLADDGALIIKFFLHISKKEQRKRFEKLTADPLNAWRVTAEDWNNHRRYEKWLQVYEEMLERTETEWGPWTIVEATDRNHTNLKVYETIIQALEERLQIKPEAALPGEQPVSEGGDGKAPQEQLVSVTNSKPA